MPHPPDEHQACTRPRRTVLLATDNQNSILAELAGGQPNGIGYCAYGQQSAPQEIATRLGYNGELREARIGWYMLGNGYRAYNTVLMRFHSPDSWSPFDSGGLNAYTYCVGDPVNFSDPTGHGILGVLRDIYSRNISFSGGSQASINARHARSISAGIKRQEATYAFGQAQGASSATAGASQSSGMGVMGAFILGAPGPRGNNNPAISDIGTTTVRHHEGYSAGAQMAGLTAGAGLVIEASSSPVPSFQARASISSNLKQGIHKNSKGNIVVTRRDSHGHLVTEPIQPVRGGGDATGTRPRTGMNYPEIRQRIVNERRTAATAIQVRQRIAVLRQAGYPRERIALVMRNEILSIRAGVNAAIN